MRHYLVNCADKEQITNYESTLAIGKASDLSCGEKACAPINNIVAGMIVMNIINFLRGADYTKIYIGNMGATERVINVLERKTKTGDDVAKDS